MVFLGGAGAPRKGRTIMKKHKKLVLARSTIRVLSTLDEGNVAGGISGQRGCHSIQDRCNPGTGGATCNDTSQDNCVSGLVSQCLC
ncbi:MAG TPA: hypothetical protein VFD36_32565 [Kofleriaceae bacterium]|nr:hypothetical protein [Kofleriaceae bacterium]